MADQARPGWIEIVRDRIASDGNALASGPRSGESPETLPASDPPKNAGDCPAQCAQTVCAGPVIAAPR